MSLKHPCFLVRASLWVLISAALLDSSVGFSAERQVLRGHVPAAVNSLSPVEDLPASTPMELTISLPWRNRAALTNLLLQMYDPASPAYHHYLSTTQFTEHFGPSEADYATLVAFAETNGLKVLSRHSSRMLLTVSAAAGDVEKAFAVKLRRYQHPTEPRFFYAPDREPSLELAIPVLEVGGLDNFSLPKPASVHPDAAAPEPLAGSGPSGNYIGNDFRNAYVPGVALTGAGQIIGLLQFNGYYTNDIAAYQSLAGRTNTVTRILTDSFSGTPNGSDIETSLDIELAMSMAPGATIYVYEGNNGTDVLTRMAEDGVVKQLSSSWTGWGTGLTEMQIFQQFALQGQSFFQASGDHDATVGVAIAPEDNPYVTVAGGTTLTMNSSATTWSNEVVWNYYNTGTGTAGSSGGSSTTFAIPVWQQGLDMAINQGSTTMRNTPDVAMAASGIYVIANNGTNITGEGGTSCAAPLWAGFCALVNQQAAANGSPSLGFANPIIYNLARSTSYAYCFHDITVGNNTNLTSTNKYFASPGYDLCTGWGSPNGSNLINALVLNSPNSLILSNGDFEYGSLTNWTLSGSATVLTNSQFVLSGFYGTRLSQSGSLGYLTQSLPTVPGKTYLISLWLENVTNGSPNQFLVSWNGTNIFNVTNLPLMAWTNLQFTVKATAAATTLQLGFRNDSGAFGLDDVGIQAVQSTPQYQSAQSGIWENPATWKISYDGVTWVAATNIPNNPYVDKVAITNGVTVTVTNTETIDRVTVYSGNTLMVGSTGNLAVAASGATDLDVFGTLNNGGVITNLTGASVVFENNSLYQHTQNGGMVPTALWNSNSTCAITGWTSATSDAGFNISNQYFGNFTWNSSGQSASLSLGDVSLYHVNGNFSVVSTGSGTLRLCLTPTYGTITLGVGGNLLLQGGILDLTGGSGPVVVNLAGNLLISGGQLTASDPTNGASDAVFNFVGGLGTQKVSITGAGSINPANHINWNVASGATVDLGTNVITGTHSFTVAAGGGLISAQTGGLNGNLGVSGAKNLSATANYAFDGSAAQVTGSALPSSVNNFGVSNFAGVTLSGNLAVSGALSIAYTNGSAPLNCGSSTLTLSDNPVIVTVAGQTPLSPGTYPLVAAGSGAGVAGDVSTSALTVNGAGLVSGSVGSLVISNGALYLTSLGPVAGNVTYLRPSGLPLKVSITNLLGYATAPAGNSLSLQGTDAVTANGLSLTSDGNYVYVPAETVNDSFNYTVLALPSDSTAKGQVFVTVTNGIGSGKVLAVNSGGITVKFSGVYGYNYTIQRSRNLVTWQNILTTNAPVGGQFQVTDSFQGLGGEPRQSYYRLLYNP